MSAYASLLQKMKPGTSWRIDRGKGNINNKLIHILAIVDDEYIVYKTWLKHKQRWHYSVEWIYYYWLTHRAGNLKKRD